MMNIIAGDIIQDNRWPEPVEINLIENMGDYVRIVGATIHSHIHIDQLIQREEFEELSTAIIESNFNANPQHIFLSLEAKRYRFASLYDPLLAMNTSKVDPLPHQIEAVYGYVLKQPRIRFLIADDPGAGKTIMAGLIIKEMKLRHQAKRILIVVPGHLKDQWRRELKDRFEESFVVVYRGLMDSFFGENVWQREDNIITSIDFAKREDVLPSLSSAQFDLIIVDEAHKMSAYRYGDKLDKTGRYRLGEVLSKNAEHLLFLTATPHKGDPENFRLFLDLLEPGYFATNELLQASIENKDNPLFIRRVKEDMKNFEGEPLFLPRYVKTLTFNLGTDSPSEKDLYNDLSEYVNTQYNKALTRDKRRNVAFALVILQRRLASSVYALFRSLERRKERLESMLKSSGDRTRIDERSFDFEIIEDLSEEERWKEEELWETLSVAENREELEREIATLDKLIQQSKSIIEKETELKVRQLKETLERLNNEYAEEKILVFTESRDTLEYLEKKIRIWGYTVNTIHGGMRLQERIEAESIFKNETQVMIATEAAGEGINLQFCHLMVNYDIPWNPNRLEQRMGRIHRYGQNKEVFVYNLVAEDTREGQVLNKLFDKLEEIKATLGSDKVFDVLSEALYGKNLSQLMLEAAASARRIEDILEDIDVQLDEDYIAQVKEQLGESLATHYIDYTRIREMAEQAREYRLIPEYTEAFFKKAFENAGGKFRIRKDELVAVDRIPFDIRKIAEIDSFRKQFGTLLKSYPKITFDKDIAFKNQDAEFLSFGHPLFEAVMGWVEKELSTSLQQGAVFVDPEGKLDGVLLFYEGEIKDGKGNVAGKRLFVLYIDSNVREIHAVNPSLLWDLAEGEPESTATVDIEDMKNQAMNSVVNELNDYRLELLDERSRQAGIKERYGIRSLEYLILKLDGELIQLYERRDQGESVDLTIFNKEEQKKNYELAFEELKHSIEQEKHLTMSAPRFIGAVRVVPAVHVEPAMVSDARIELVGMEVAMDFEREHGRIPEDISAENLGFDIRSRDGNGKLRYIEVKARAQQGAVALTQNEWFKAKRFTDDYYLYAVMNAANSPELVIIRNPVENLEPEAIIESVRYIVPFKEIIAKGEMEVG